MRQKKVTPKLSASKRLYNGSKVFMNETYGGHPVIPSGSTQSIQEGTVLIDGGQIKLVFGERIILLLMFRGVRDNS